MKKAVSIVIAFLAILAVGIGAIIATQEPSNNVSNSDSTSAPVQSDGGFGDLK